MALDDATFDSLAGETLEAWFDAIEAAGLDDLEVELGEGILTVNVESGGTFVLNKHAPMRQLWLSSPYSGATHYSFDPAGQRWINTRGGQDLATLLADELGRAGGGRLVLE